MRKGNPKLGLLPEAVRLVAGFSGRRPLYQGINTADAEAGEEKLEGYAHRHYVCSGQGMPLSAQIVYSLKSICLMNTISPLSFLTML
jgi:hypothetical protein